MFFDRRFLKKESTRVYGSPIQSLQIMGFDRRYGKYTFVGYDNFGTYYVTGDGVFDSADNSLKLKGQEQDPSRGVQQFDIVLHFVSPTKVRERGDFQERGIRRAQGLQSRRDNIHQGQIGLPALWDHAGRPAVRPHRAMAAPCAVSQVLQI